MAERLEVGRVRLQEFLRGLLRAFRGRRQASSRRGSLGVRRLRSRSRSSRGKARRQELCRGTPSRRSFGLFLRQRRPEARFQAVVGVPSARPSATLLLLFAGSTPSCRGSGFLRQRRRDDRFGAVVCAPVVCPSAAWLLLLFAWNSGRHGLQRGCQKIPISRSASRRVRTA